MDEGFHKQQTIGLPIWKDESWTFGWQSHRPTLNLSNMHDKMAKQQTFFCV